MEGIVTKLLQVMLMLEIERKFLIDAFPDELPLLKHVELEQAYLSIEPEIRIHKAMDVVTGKMDFRMTIKGDGELTRKEIVTDIPKAFYCDAMGILGKNAIKKEYKAYRLGEWILEVAHVEPDTQNPFFYAEIEFPMEADAKAFVPPDYLGQEVTFDKEYKMKNYWKRTRL